MVGDDAVDLEARCFGLFGGIDRKWSVLGRNDEIAPTWT
jgi:hypothetical protein